MGHGLQVGVFVGVPVGVSVGVDVAVLVVVLVEDDVAVITRMFVDGGSVGSWMKRMTRWLSSGTISSGGSGMMGGVEVRVGVGRGRSTSSKSIATTKSGTSEALLPYMA